MSIIQISTNQKNLDLLQSFITKDHGKFFRYYQKRTIEAIKNHILTLLLVDENNEPVGYAHVDNEGDKSWFGICLLEGYQGKGYGKILLEKVKKLVIDRPLWLSVDKDNFIAQKLYLQSGFKVQKETEHIIFMKLD